MLFYLFLQKWTAPLLLNLFLYERPAVPRPYGWGFKAVRSLKQTPSRLQLRQMINL